MGFSRSTTWLLFSLIVSTVPVASQAQVICVSNVSPPPELPVYEQPPIPAPGYLWTPGYWASGPKRSSACPRVTGKWSFVGDLKIVFARIGGCRRARRTAPGADARRTCACRSMFTMHRDLAGWITTASSHAGRVTRSLPPSILSATRVETPPITSCAGCCSGCSLNFTRPSSSRIATTQSDGRGGVPPHHGVSTCACRSIFTTHRDLVGWMTTASSHAGHVTRSLPPSILSATRVRMSRAHVRRLGCSPAARKNCETTSVLNPHRTH